MVKIMPKLKCCICGNECIFGLSILKYRKKICTACKASLFGMINLEFDVDLPINDIFGFTFFTPSNYTHYPSGKKRTTK